MTALLTFALSAPVETTTGPITAINITRLPEARNFLQSGLPMDGAGEYDMEALVRLLADCSDAPEFTFGRMDGADLLSLSMNFGRLLVPDAAPPWPLRRPTGEDLLRAGAPINAAAQWNIRSLLKLGARLSERSEDEVRALSCGQFLALVQGIAGFLARQAAS